MSSAPISRAVLAQQLVGGVVGLDVGDAEHPLGLVVVRRERLLPVGELAPTAPSLVEALRARGRACSRSRASRRRRRAPETTATSRNVDSRKIPRMPEPRRVEVAAQVPGGARQLVVGEPAAALHHRDAVALLAQPQRGDAAAEARADDQPVVVVFLTHRREA